MWRGKTFDFHQDASTNHQVGKPRGYDRRDGFDQERRRRKKHILQKRFSIPGFSTKPNSYSPGFQRKSEGTGQNKGNSWFHHEQSRLRDHGNLPHRLRITRGILRTERGVIQRSHKSAKRLLALQVFILGKPLSRGLARRRLDRVKEIDSPVRNAKWRASTIDYGQL